MNRIFYYKLSIIYLMFTILFGLIILFFSTDYKPSIVWIVISVLFYPLIVLSLFSKHKTLQFFIFTLYLAHGIGSPLFFLQKDIYDVTGFSAIKNFNFSVNWYLEIYIYVFIFFYSTLYFTIFFKRIIPTNFVYVDRLNLLNNKSYSKFSSILLVLFILLLSFINYWMFNNGIGLTGIEPPRLPYKLSGFLYFFSRFFAPFIILYFYSKSSRSYTITFIILTYALLAGISTVSRTTLTMYWLPVLFFSIVDKKYFLLFFSIFLFFTIFPLIENARNYVYQINDGVVGMNMNNNLFSIAEEVFKTKDIISLKEAMFGFVGRLGGTQDVVLADQYNNVKFANSYYEFLRVFFLSTKIDILKVQEELYGFSPPQGFSPGDGAITASVLIISNKNLFILIFVSFFISILIHINEILIFKISKILNYNELTVLLALLFNMIFVPRLNMLWLYGFLIILLFINLIVRYSFIKRIIN